MTDIYQLRKHYAPLAQPAVCGMRPNSFTPRITLTHIIADVTCTSCIKIQLYQEKR